MASGKQNKRTALRAYVDGHRPGLITEIEFGELLCALAPVSEGYLRRLLRETGVPLAPLVGGIRQDSFEQLERTLIEMLREYEDAVAGGNAPRAKACRAAVITAKDHARFALRRPALTAGERAGKEEMLLWMFTWLENPGVFPAWLELRKRVRGVIEVTAPGAGPGYSLK